ncbi:MAG: MBL fold metallo-hydrolase [Candidatus Omnitrophica bacterium]|nr:MBL fold metallo-hydrolase [Candidatus Omnitrophota bacterium]MBU1925591.1 MBL fold metallo-hydrolase [Candidatus Omnitrophota bacterium]MBU2064177.1 MBL fold metallo-hydrolase [Candidatus Omnitrophota bacterium]
MPTILKFCGGTREVSGSNHLIQTDSSKVLLDAGLFYGHRQEFYQNNTNFVYNPFDIDALILSHVHIDHSGNIPSLVKRGYRNRVYTTSATKSLCRLMLLDSGKIQEQDVKFVNKIHRRKNLPSVKPLYTKKEAEYCMRFFRGVSYHRKIRVTKDIHITFYEAGHILGSALVLLEIKENSRRIKVGYVVDLGRADLPLINSPEFLQGLDYLIIESTYGNRMHPPISEAKEKLAQVVNTTINRAGKVIIPSFAMERTQEILCFLSELMEERKIKDVPIYLDSPLAIDITAVFKRHLSYLDARTQKLFSEGLGPFLNRNMVYMRKVNESKKLNRDSRPMIIIAGSGMCESGRILHHLKNNIEDKKNTILVVGYMAKNTLGKRLVERQRRVRIFGEEYDLNAEVVVNNAFSGHADRDALIEYVQKCRDGIKKIFVVHGDEDQSLALVKRLRERGYDVYAPYKNEEIEL